MNIYEHKERRGNESFKINITNNVNYLWHNAKGSTILILGLFYHNQDRIESVTFVKCLDSRLPTDRSILYLCAVTCRVSRSKY